MAVRVLLVEDDFLIRMTIAEALADDGFVVVEAGSAEEALRALDDDPAIGLLITDIQLPGGADGHAVARQARGARPGLPVIYTTGRPEPLGHGGGPDLLIAKPYLPSEICAAARRMLEKQE